MIIWKNANHYQIIIKLPSTWDFWGNRLGQINYLAWWHTFFRWFEDESWQSPCSNNVLGIPFSWLLISSIEELPNHKDTLEFIQDNMILNGINLFWSCFYKRLVVLKTDFKINPFYGMYFVLSENYVQINHAICKKCNINSTLEYSCDNSATFPTKKSIGCHCHVWIQMFLPSLYPNHQLPSLINSCTTWYSVANWFVL